MQVQVFLDCSASMGKDNPKKGSYAVATAAALGYLAVHNMDKVSFHLIKGDRSENPFGTIIGKNAFFRAISTIGEMGFRRRGGHRERNSELSGDRNEQRTVCNNLGLFHGKRLEEGGGLPVLQKRQVLLVQVLSPEETDPTYDGRVNLIDSESVDMSDQKNMKIRITRSMQKAYEEALRL